MTQIRHLWSTDFTLLNASCKYNFSYALNQPTTAHYRARLKGFSRVA